MAQEKKWDDEYGKPRLVGLSDVPQADMRKFLKWLRKERGFEIDGAKVLDVGSGAGKNASYIAGLGATVVGLEISDTAIRLAEEREKGREGRVKYYKHDIGSPYPLPDATFDLALDIMSSNSLSEDERDICASEIARVLAPGGWLYMRALCKDADSNAGALLKKYPGPERDTYVVPNWGLVERVWSRKDFEEYYSRLFKFEYLEKKTNFSKFDGRTFKRNYWVAYLRKTG